MNLKYCFIISSYCKCCDKNKDDIIDSLCHHDHECIHEPCMIQCLSSTIF